MRISGFRTALEKWSGGKRLLPPPERAGFFAFLFAAGFLVYLYGALSADFRLFPYGMVQNAYKAVLGLMEANTTFSYSEYLFAPAGDNESAVTADREGRGDTLITFTSFHEPTVYLMDRSARVIHRWTDPFSDEEKREFSKDTFDPFVYYVPKYRIDPEGNLVGLYFSYGIHPKSLGIFKIDRHSNVIWKNFDHNVHHDIDLGPDGRIYTLSNDFSPDVPEGLGDLPGPVVLGHVLILGDDGHMLDRIGLLQAIRNSGFEQYLNEDVIPVGNPTGDYLHTNAVKYITAQMAREFPYGDTGDLLISMRNIHALGVLDVSERKFIWMTRGPWIGQHDPDLLENGNILLFDNLGSDKRGGKSRIIEIRPDTMEIVWSYEGRADRPFETRYRGSQQRIGNGNTLITESNSGRVFEVTRSGEIVWEFRNPLRKGDRTDLVPTVRWGEALEKEYFAPGFRADLEKAARQPLGRPPDPDRSRG